MPDQHESPRNSMTTPSHDDVARRAYELFEARGGEPGHDLEHWLDAERQLTSWRKTKGNKRLRADRQAATADE